MTVTEIRLTVDPKRADNHNAYNDCTEIFVRAYHPVMEQWGSWDIATLDKGSLMQWLNKRPGYASDVVLMLLGHTP